MHLLVENVVGFEGSRTRARMVEVMQAAGYAVQVSAVQTTQYDLHFSSLVDHVSSQRANTSLACCEDAFHLLIAHRACTFSMG